MKVCKFFITLGACAMLAFSSGANAHRHHEHHYWAPFAVGAILGGVITERIYAPRYVYTPPPQIVYTPAPPVVYTLPPPAYYPPRSLVYYCRSYGAYYPEVTSCPVPWMTLPSP